MGQTPDFDSIKQTNVYGMEYWSARDLMPLLGYDKWERFHNVIKKGMTACQESGNVVEDHFPSAGKIVELGANATRSVQDYALSRLACYLIAQNGDLRKPEIAAAQLYFAISTRANEMHQLREEQERRLEMRLKESESYKQLGEAARQAGVQSETFGIFIDGGYLGLHRHTLRSIAVIALPCFLSTVKKHVSNLLVKLEAGSRTQAVARTWATALLLANSHKATTKLFDHDQIRLTPAGRFIVQ